jgi:hypothetical protein
VHGPFYVPFLKILYMPLTICTVYTKKLQKCSKNKLNFFRASREYFDSLKSLSFLIPGYKSCYSVTIGLTFLYQLVLAPIKFQAECWKMTMSNLKPLNKLRCISDHQKWATAIIHIKIFFRLRRALVLDTMPSTEYRPRVVPQYHNCVG